MDGWFNGAAEYYACASRSAPAPGPFGTEATPDSLTADEKKICASMGMTPEEFIESRAKHRATDTFEDQ